MLRKLVRQPAHTNKIAFLLQQYRIKTFFAYINNKKTALERLITEAYQPPCPHPQICFPFGPGRQPYGILGGQAA